jgi:hypothetical protein
MAVIVYPSNSGGGGGSTTVYQPVVEVITLVLGDLSSKFVELANTPFIASDVTLSIGGAPGQTYGDDFVVTGNILSWNGLALDGILVAGDKFTISYSIEITS